MKNNLFVVAAFAALACAGLRAQTVELRANVPFDFQAGGRLVPAGEYLVEGRGVIVFLREAADGKSVSAFITNEANALHGRGKARLEFHRYGGQYFLSEIWDSFSDQGRQLPRTAREKELAQRGDLPAKAVVYLASTK
jgi:hypothetical protein